MDLQTEIMQRLFSGQNINDIMSEISKKMGAEKLNQQPKEVEVSPAILMAGRPHLELLFNELISLLYLFNRDQEAKVIEDMTGEQREALLAHFNEYVDQAVSLINTMKQMKI